MVNKISELLPEYHSGGFAAVIDECPRCGPQRGSLYDREGRWFPCPDCEDGHLQAMAALERYKRSSEMPERYFDFTGWQVWRTVNPALLQGKITAIQACKLFAETFPAGFALVELDGKYAEHTVQREWILLRGRNGMGKTALAATVANVIMQDHLKRAAFITPRGLWFRLKRSFDRDSEDVEAKIIADLCTVPLLVIDEFNIQASEYMKTVIEQVVRERYNASRPLPVVFTANATLEELEALWGRQTMSPVREKAHLIPMKGEPLRKENPAVEIEVD